MRKLNTSDMFKAARILNKMNIKEDIKRLVNEGQKMSHGAVETDTQSLGIDLIFVLLEAADNSKAENELYDFLAGVTQKTIEEIKEQSIETTIEDFKQIANENNLKNFLGAVAKLQTK